MNKRRLLLVSSALVLPVLLFPALPAALAQMLLWPAYRMLRPLSNSEIGSFIVLGVALSWVLWSLVLGLALELGRIAFLRYKAAFFVGIGIVGVALFFQIRGSRSRAYDGLWERGFEHSDFFYSGNCNRPRYWLIPTTEVDAKLDTLGNPTAVRLKFIGTTTSIGEYGHLGQYLREIRVERVISVEPAEPCIHR